MPEFLCLRGFDESKYADGHAGRTGVHGFEFLANLQNLPLWAVGFAHAIRQEGEQWIVKTAGGEMPIRLETDSDRGVIDYWSSPAPGVEFPAYSRVIPNADGAEYVFTMFQAPGMSDDVFQGQVTALQHEFNVLARWSAAGVLEAERGFRRIRGYAAMGKLIAALQKHEAKLNGDVPDSAVAVA